MLPPGYRMELVLADPDIDNPAVIEFDGNGRMYVSECVTYMPDVEGTGQREPVSRISVQETRTATASTTSASVFADKLVLPRMVLPLDEAQHPDERDGLGRRGQVDRHQRRRRRRQAGGVLQRRRLGRDGNLEHEQSGFVWGLDNWIYSTYNSFRFRWTPTGIVREPTGPNGGQWGLTQDDDGKMWFVVRGGASAAR